MLDLSYQPPKPKVIAGAKYDWELVIGMEIHAQLSGDSRTTAMDPSTERLIGEWRQAQG